MADVPWRYSWSCEGLNRKHVPRISLARQACGAGSLAATGRRRRGRLHSCTRRCALGA